MRAVLAGLALALMLSATPSVALADGGDEDTNADKPDNNDPGITALHDAVDDMRDARVAMRADCPNMGDPKCRDEFKKIRDAFQDARAKAIAKHHDFREAAKAAAKDKADAAKDKAKGKPADLPKPTSTTKP